MSFIVDSFDDASKWMESIFGAGAILNRTQHTFQVSISDLLSQAGLVAIQPINLIGQDISVLTNSNTTSGIGLGPLPTGELDNYSYWFVRSNYDREVQVWQGGVLASIPDIVPIDQLSELRITIIPDTNYPRGLISFYYEGELLYQEEIKSWIDPLSNYVSVFAAVGGIGEFGTNTYQFTGYVPPPSVHNLSINSNPLGIPFIIKEVLI